MKTDLKRMSRMIMESTDLESIDLYEKKLYDAKESLMFFERKQHDIDTVLKYYSTACVAL